MAGNANYPSTALLVRGTGDNNSTTPLDLSLTPKTLTAYGDAKITTSVADPFGASNGVLTFDGTGDYFSIPDSADLELGAGNFTTYAWVRLTGYSSSSGGNYAANLISKDSATTGRAFILSIGGTASSYTSVTFGGFEGNGSGTYTVIDIGYTFSLNTWYFIECTRSGNLIYLFVNGTLLNSGGTEFSRTIQNTTTTWKLGSTEYDATFKYYLPGQLSDVNIIPGVAWHTAGYTAPTAPTVAGLGQLTGNYNKGVSTISSWRAKASKCSTGVLSSTAIITGTTYTLDCPTLDPHEVTISAAIDYAWSANKVAELGDFVSAANPDTTQFQFEVTTAGTFHATDEPTWNTTAGGTTTSGTATLTCRGALKDPVTIGPKIPS